jgi:BirA family transcriptional regulator, biotin operon repressor / biotin---[acetyl-CoA-carboxylase] ligase
VIDGIPADRVVGRHILRYESVTSTNDIARQLVSCQTDEGTVITAAEQTLGRGSHGKTWISPAGVNLLVSVILRPRVPTRRIPEMAFVASLAVAEYLMGCGMPARVKWPNDIRVNGRKIAGILIEAVPVQGTEPSAIVGIGLNLNWSDLSLDLAETATSVLIETGRCTDVSDALGGLLSSLEAVYGEYRREGFGRILARWKPLDCLTGSEVVVACDGEPLRGTSEGIDATGALLVRMPDGTLKSISAASLLSEQQ